MGIITKGMGVILKPAARKDKLLDSIRKRRTRNLPKSLQNKKIKIEGKEYKSDQYIMDVETYDKVQQKKFKSRK